MIVILTEKPSAARNFAKALGGSGGTYNVEKHLIVSARGHLLAYSTDMNKQVPEELAEKYRKWSMENLMWQGSLQVRLQAPFSLKYLRKETKWKQEK